MLQTVGHGILIILVVERGGIVVNDLKDKILNILGRTVIADRTHIVAQTAGHLAEGARIDYRTCLTVHHISAGIDFLQFRRTERGSP